MENDNSLGGISAQDGVSASSDVQESSPETNSQIVDPTKNLKSEMNRKFSKINEQLTKLVQFVETSQTRQPVENTDVTQAPDYKRYVDARLQEDKKTQAKAVHQQQFQEAVTAFPELNQESETYDADFYKTVDRYYSKLVSADPTDPNALTDALELAASKLGKNQRLIQEKILKDDARRSRILSEGGSAPKDNKKSKEPTVNEAALARLGITGKKLDRLKTGLKNQE